MPKRRDVLKLGLLAGAAAALPVERLTEAFAESASAAGPVVKLFDTPLAIPPVLKPNASVAGTDYYDMTIRAGQADILPGLKTPIWGYNGIFPGPTIRLPDPARGEFVGEVAVINGKPSPFFKVEQRAYRFRLLNGSSLDTLHELTLGTGDTFHVIGSDGGLLTAPAPVTKLPLAPSERAEVVIDFRHYPVGSQVVLSSSIFGTPLQLIRFDVKKAVGPSHRLPGKLMPIPRLKESQARVHRDFQLNLDKATGEMVINGKSFDPDRIDTTPKLGSTEVWTTVNGETPDLPIPHVFHTHLVRFHLLGHADAGMMAQLKVVL